MTNITDEQFDALRITDVDTEKEREEAKKKITDAFYFVKDMLKEYCDMEEQYYDVVSLWILGTYFHSNFPSYPYLYFNATKGSGKSRTMGLVVTLCNGEMLNSLTEAVLFRTKGTLGIDEFESVERKGKEGLRELLNSAYKKGIKVKRMKKQRTEKGEQQVVEEFEVYRPIVMANIWGMENVLEDRCISIILEKSYKKEVTNLIEMFRTDPKIKVFLEEMEFLKNNIWCSLCSVVTMENIYTGWNTYIKHNNTNNTNNTHHINNTNNTKNTDSLYNLINSTGIGGRDLELCLPLILIANEISEEILKITTLTLQSIILAKKDEEFIENKDVSLTDFVSQQTSEIDNWIPTTKLIAQFRNFLDTDEEWINVKWLGRALKRLKLYKEKRRRGKGVEVILNVEKAKEKMRRYT